MASTEFIPEKAAEPDSRHQKRSGGGGKVVAGKYEIDTASPLATFEHPYAEAYECALRDGGMSDHVAYVMKDRYPIRRTLIDKLLANNDIESMVTLATTQMVDWVDGGRRYAIVYKRPEGPPIMASMAHRREPISEEMIRRGIIRPITHVIRRMAGLGLFHGNIRPTNIFLTNYDNAQAVLGECASSIPGILQPIILETIERGMSQQQGKGAGNETDDIYSFGATIAILMRGFNPLEGKSDRFIIEEKIQRGSYAVLTDGLRLSPGLSEFLRATLNDDPRQRWDVEQLTAWTEGNRATPKSASSAQKAQRHLEFNGKKYLRPRMLAKDLHEKPEEAIELIESGNLGKWVERALGDQAMLTGLNQAIGRASTNGRTAGFEDRLLCYASMALDPMAPIRYKGMVIMPGGIGHSMALAMLAGENVQIYGELIRDRVAWVWLNQKENYNDNVGELIQLFDHSSKLIVRRGINYGIERCLYEICPDVPCLSDYFKEHYVVDCHGLLKALNQVANEHKSSRAIDRHIASFISTRDTRDNSGLIMMLEDPNKLRQSLALLTMYQQMQRRYNIQKLVGLAEWLQADAEMVAQRFRNIENRKEILKQIPKDVASGSLTRVLTTIDNPAQVRKDEFEYLQAVQQYAVHHREKESIRNQLLHNPQYGFGTGRQVALVVSMIVSAVVIACVLVSRFSGPVM